MEDYGKPSTKRRKVPKPEPVARQFTCDFTRDEPYECGAILLTLLAYPEPNVEERVQAALHQSLCHLHLRAQAETDDEWANRPQAIKPCYAFVDPKQVARSLRQFERRLRDRMIAARMANPYLREVINGKVPPLPAGIARLSLNELSKLVETDLPTTNQADVEKRVWRPSLPVIHLAAALDVTIREVERAHGVRIYLGHLMMYPALILHVLRTAQVYADLLYKSPSLFIPPNMLIELIAVE